MAESQEAKTLSLSEQYALKEKDEKVGSDTKAVEVKEVETPEEQPSAPAADPDATASAVEESSASEPAPAPAVSEETTETAAPEESSDNTETSAAAEQEEEEEEPAPKEVPEIKLESAPADPRFPTTNQTRHCFTRYVEYHRCVAAKGEGAPECDKFKKYYRALCPSEWVERWDEQRENGTFPGPL